MDSVISDLLSSTPEGRRELARAKLRVKAALQLELRMEALGQSRAALAERLGISRSAVSQALSGDRNLSLNTLADMAQALGLDVHLELQAAEQRGQPQPAPARTTAVTTVASRDLAAFFTVDAPRARSTAAALTTAQTSVSSTAFDNKVAL